MDTTTLSLVSACTALVASVVGPVVTLAVARRQINANVLSANRQKWIESLRETMAEMISLMVAVIVVKQNWHGEWRRGRGAIAADPALLDKLERMILVGWKIRLLLHPSEPEQVALVRRLDEALTTMAQHILREAWRRVKAGT